MKRKHSNCIGILFDRGGGGGGGEEEAAIASNVSEYTLTIQFSNSVEC